jgi:NAD(P)-dependent dehydrogenase (short-subunit alcohol dehydrogenase family)
VNAARVALVTGAARRVGRALALRLASRGYAVVVHYRSSAEEARETVAAIEAAGGRAHAVRADQRVEAEVVAAVEEAARVFGRLDLLVNSASAFPADREGGATAADFVEVLRANVVGPYVFARAAAPHLRQVGGRIVFLGDIYADRPLRGYLAYSASKAALHSLVKSLAREFAPAIAVNAIAPGVVLAPEDADPRTMEAILRRTPSGRHGTPDDVGAALDFLAEAPHQITGQILAVDGGRTLVP